MSHELFCLKKGEYTATIIQSYHENKELIVVWCIDSGEQVWRKLFDRIPINKIGEKKLAKLQERIGVVLFFDGLKDKLLPSQLIGLRSKLTVDYILDKDRRAWINVIGDYDVALEPATYDVTKPKTDKLYTKQLNKKRLPINHIKFIMFVYCVKNFILCNI